MRLNINIKIDVLMVVIIKWVLTHSGERAWSNHGPDAQRFMKNFHQFNLTVLQFISNEKKRYYIVLSESEFVSFRTLQWIRSL